MFKFYLSATLVVILSTLNSTVLATQSDATNQSVQASKSTLVVRQIPHIFTTVTDAETTVLVADSSSNTQDVVEKLGGARALLAIAAVGGTVGVILSARKANNISKSKTIPSFSTTEDLISINQASRKLQKQVLRLLHDDQATANRLLSQVKIKNPNRSIDWCVEKVIYDLDRDRGRY